MDVTRDRSIRFQEHDLRQHWERLECLLMEVPGVTGVTLDERRHSITVQYDLLKVYLADIEGVLLKAGFTFADSFLYRIRRRWIHSTEKNERANMQHSSPICCSNPKEIYRLKSNN